MLRKGLSRALSKSNLSSQEEVPVAVLQFAYQMTLKADVLLQISMSVAAMHNAGVAHTELLARNVHIVESSPLWIQLANLNNCVEMTPAARAKDAHALAQIILELCFCDARGDLPESTYFSSRTPSKPLTKFQRFDVTKEWPGIAQQSPIIKAYQQPIHNVLDALFELGCSSDVEWKLIPSRLESLTNTLRDLVDFCKTQMKQLPDQKNPISQHDMQELGCLDSLPRRYFDARGLNLRGLGAIHNGMVKESIRYFYAALERDPTFNEAQLNFFFAFRMYFVNKTYGVGSGRIAAMMSVRNFLSNLLQSTPSLATDAAIATMLVRECWFKEAYQFIDSAICYWEGVEEDRNFWQDHIFPGLATVDGRVAQFDKEFKKLFKESYQNDSRVSALESQSQLLHSLRDFLSVSMSQFEPITSLLQGGCMSKSAAGGGANKNVKNNITSKATPTNPAQNKTVGGFLARLAAVVVHGSVVPPQVETASGLPSILFGRQVTAKNLVFDALGPSHMLVRIPKSAHPLLQAFVTDLEKKGGGATRGEPLYDFACFVLRQPAALLVKLGTDRRQSECWMWSFDCRRPIMHAVVQSNAVFVLAHGSQLFKYAMGEEGKIRVKGVMTGGVAARVEPVKAVAVVHLPTVVKGLLAQRGQEDAAEAQKTLSFEILPDGDILVPCLHGSKDRIRFVWFSQNLALRQSKTLRCSHEDDGPSSIPLSTVASALGGKGKGKNLNNRISIGDSGAKGGGRGISFIEKVDDGSGPSKEAGAFGSSVGGRRSMFRRRSTLIGQGGRRPSILSGRKTSFDARRGSHLGPNGEKTSATTVMNVFMDHGESKVFVCRHSLLQSFTMDYGLNRQALDGTLGINIVYPFDSVCWAKDKSSNLLFVATRSKEVYAVSRDTGNLLFQLMQETIKSFDRHLSHVLDSEKDEDDDLSDQSEDSEDSVGSLMCDLRRSSLDRNASRRSSFFIGRRLSASNVFGDDTSSENDNSESSSSDGSENSSEDDDENALDLSLVGDMRVYVPMHGLVVIAKGARVYLYAAGNRFEITSTPKSRTNSGVSSGKRNSGGMISPSSPRGGSSSPTHTGAVGGTAVIRSNILRAGTNSSLPDESPKSATLESSFSNSFDEEEELEMLDDIEEEEDCGDGAIGTPSMADDSSERNLKRNQSMKKAFDNLAAGNSKGSSSDTTGRAKDKMEEAPRRGSMGDAPTGGSSDPLERDGDEPEPPTPRSGGSISFADQLPFPNMSSNITPGLSSQCSDPPSPTMVVDQERSMSIMLEQFIPTAVTLPDEKVTSFDVFEIPHRRIENVYVTGANDRYLPLMIVCEDGTEISICLAYQDGFRRAMDSYKLQSLASATQGASMGVGGDNNLRGRNSTHGAMQMMNALGVISEDNDSPNNSLGMGNVMLTSRKTSIRSGLRGSIGDAEGSSIDLNDLSSMGRSTLKAGPEGAITKKTFSAFGDNFTPAELDKSDFMEAFLRPHFVVPTLTLPQLMLSQGICLKMLTAVREAAERISLRTLATDKDTISKLPKDQIAQRVTLKYCAVILNWLTSFCSATTPFGVLDSHRIWQTIAGKIFLRPAPPLV